MSHIISFVRVFTDITEYQENHLRTIHHLKNESESGEGERLFKRVADELSSANNFAGTQSKNHFKWWL